LEAWLERAEIQGVLGDGAEWDLEHCRSTHFPGAIQIVRISITPANLMELAPKLYPNQEVQAEAHGSWSRTQNWMTARLRSWLRGLRSIESPDVELAEQIRTEANYFEKNAQSHAVSPSFARPTPVCRLRSNPRPAVEPLLVRVPNSPECSGTVRGAMPSSPSAAAASAAASRTTGRPGALD